MGGVLRDSVNGKKKYARMLIRRRRTPILADEFMEMADRYVKDGLSNEIMLQEAYSLCEAGEYEQAGKIFTFMDFMDMIEVVPLQPEKGGQQLSNKQA